MELKNGNVIEAKINIYCWMTLCPKATRGVRKMNIGSGLYGPATNVTPNREKHWPPFNERTRTEYRG